MKKLALFLLLTMVIALSAEAHKYRNRNAHISISVQTFYNELSPYGDWIYSPDHGYVWRPYFDHFDNFRPYSSAGHWVNTAYGWNWVSDYEWGWATFHYGRWYFDDYLGWMWIPGYEWAPSWVTWGYYGDYYGWAPLGPEGYVYNTGWNAPATWWTFVPRRHFCSNNWNHYIYDRHVQVNNITYITNIYNYNDNSYNNTTNWYYGPRVSDVERHTNSRVRQMQVVESSRPVNRITGSSRLEVYRPIVDRKEEGRRPEQFSSIDDSRRTSSRVSTEARRNDPGTARTRDSRIENRTGTATPAIRNSSTQIDSRNEQNTRNSRPAGARIETRTESITPANRNSATRSDARDERNSINERNTRNTVEPRNTSPSVRNTNSQSLPAPQRENRSVEPSREAKTSASGYSTETSRLSTSRNNETIRPEVKRESNKSTETNKPVRNTEVKQERQVTNSPQNRSSERTTSVERRTETVKENNTPSRSSSTVTPSRSGESKSETRKR